MHCICEPVKEADCLERGGFPGPPLPPASVCGRETLYTDVIWRRILPHGVPSRDDILHFMCLEASVRLTKLHCRVAIFLLNHNRDIDGRLVYTALLMYPQDPTWLGNGSGVL